MPAEVQTAGTRERALAVAGVLAGAAFLAGLAFDSPSLRIVAKPVPALCLAAWVAWRGRGPAARPLGLGLLLSALGDWLLEYDPGTFLPGLLAFLAAHVAYAAGFLLETRRPSLARALPFALWGVLGYLGMRPGLGRLALPVVVYLTAICVMMWRAAAGVGRDGPPRPHEWMALAGAVLFGLSDTLIGLDRFRAPIESASVAIILLYWTGQLGIAASAVVRPLGYAPPGTGDR